MNMSSQYLEGELLYKGERGYSAYQVAVLNGYVGTEEEWLSTLGTSSHFSEDKEIYTATAGQTVYDLPAEYQVNFSFIDIYVNGFRLNSDEYSIDTTTKKATLVHSIEAGNKVEIVCLTMSTNNLPIIDSIGSSSTDLTVSTSKAVYDFVADTVAEAKTDLVNDTTAGATTCYSSNKVNTLINALDTETDTKLSLKLTTSDIQVLTGSVANIQSGATVTADINYPTGFTKSNTVIISSMCSAGNNYYDTTDSELTANGFPQIYMIALTDSYIRVWLKNTNNSGTRNGYYKIGLMKVS